MVHSQSMLTGYVSGQFGVVKFPLEAVSTPPPHGSVVGGWVVVWVVGGCVVVWVVGGWVVVWVVVGWVVGGWVVDWVVGWVVGTSSAEKFKTH